MPRNQIVLKLDSPSGTVQLNFGNEDAGHVRIKTYTFSGVSNSLGFFISFNNIATLPVTAGSNRPGTIPYSSQEFYLPLGVIQNNFATFDFNKPVPIMGGDNLMTNNQLIEYRINDALGQPAQFQFAVLVMDFVPRSQFNQIKGDRIIDNKIKIN